MGLGPRASGLGRTRRVLRAVVRVIAVAVVVVLVVAASVLVALHTDAGRDLLRRQIEAQLDGVLVHGATIGRLDGSVLGEVEFRDVAIPGADGAPAITAGVVRVRVRPWSLVRHVVAITELEVDGVDVDTTRLAGVVLPRPQRPSPWVVELSGVAVRGGHVALRGADLDDVRIDGSARIPGDGAKLASLLARATWRQRDVPVMALAQASLDGDRVAVPALVAWVGDATVAASGVSLTLRDGKLPTGTGTIAVAAPRGTIAKLAPGIAVPGDVHAAVVVGAGPATAMPVAASLRVGAATASANVAVDVDGRALRGRVVATDVELAPLTADRVAGVASLTMTVDYARELAVTGTVTAGRVTTGGVAVTGLSARIDATGLPAHPAGSAAVHVDRVARGNIWIEQLDATARTRGDGNIDVAVSSSHVPGATIAELAAVVTPPDATGTTVVELGRHRIRVDATGGDWSGQGGRVVIAPATIAVTGLRSASAVGRIAADVRATRDATGLRGLDVTLAVRHVVAGMLDGAHALDATVRLDARPGDASLDASAQVATIGSASVTAKLAAPADLGDVAAWQRLGITAVRELRLGARDVDVGRLAELAGVRDVTGHLDGDVEVASASASGRVTLAGLRAPALRGLRGVDATLTLARAAADELDPTVAVTVDGIGSATAALRVALPPHPFDVAAWRRLGARALRGATVTTSDVAIDPALLDRLGVAATLRGTAKLTVEIAAGARDARLHATVLNLKGEAIAQPLELQLDATADDGGATATLDVATAAQGVTAGATSLAEVHARAPVSLATLLDDPRRARTTPIEATVTLASTSAPRLLGVFGRSEVTGGTVSGSVRVDGTLAAPHVRANVTATDLAVPPGPGGSPVEVLRHVAVGATWDGAIATLALDARGDDRGNPAAGASTLAVRARAAPGHLEAGTATLAATHFNLAPLLAFAPGPGGGARGVLDADLAITGLDPHVAQLRGYLKLHDARLPISPQVGTLRDANIDVDVRSRDIAVDAAGKLGGGDVTVKGTVGLDGAALAGGSLKLELRQVSPIGAVEPKITADVTAKLARDGARWKAEVSIDRGTVTVPSSSGEQLKPVGLPPDLVVGRGRGAGAAGARVAAAPIDPFLIAHVVIHDTHVDADQLRTTIRGDVKVAFAMNAVGIDGEISAVGGDLDLFGRRYRVDRGDVRFDGSTDPRLDIAITYDFSDVTTTTQVRGRLSKPELELTSDPATYTKEQLLGFLLGGEPGGNPNTGSVRDVAASSGESLIANQIGGYVRKALPIDIDVIRYEAASVATSAAITVGSWITRSLFLSYRNRPSPRPDENADEATLEWWLTHRLEVQATAGDRNVDGVDVLWRRRF